jgi:hypothetical protein
MSNPVNLPLPAVVLSPATAVVLPSTVNTLNGLHQQTIASENTALPGTDAVPVVGVNEFAQLDAQDTYQANTYAAGNYALRGDEGLNGAGSDQTSATNRDSSANAKSDHSLTGPSGFRDNSNDLLAVLNAAFGAPSSSEAAAGPTVAGYTVASGNGAPVTPYDTLIAAIQANLVAERGGSVHAQTYPKPSGTFINTSA